MSHNCPRRNDNFIARTEERELDNYRADGTCSYCGSLNPTTFMARLRLGDVELGPTDKGYKVYVRNTGGAMFARHHRTDNDRSGDRTKWVWVLEPTSETKFYFQHLDEASKGEFIELVNCKKVNIGYPGYFYTIPYFCRKIEPETNPPSPNDNSQPE